MFREPNPIFWLEFRQAFRQRIWLLLFLFIVVGTFSIAGFSTAPSFGFSRDFVSTIYFCVFGIASFVVAIYSGIRLAMQQINEDLILRTPLSGVQVLWGKFQFSTLLLSCFFIPCLPLLLETPCEIMPILQWYIWGLALIAIGLGFMAGARTTAGAVTLAGLAIFFVWLNFIGNWLIQEYFLRYITLSIFLDDNIVWIFAGLIGFNVGIVTLFPESSQSKTFYTVALMIIFIPLIFLTLFALAFSFIKYKYNFDIPAMLVMFVFYVGPPTIVIGFWGNKAMLNDD